MKRIMMMLPLVMLFMACEVQLLEKDSSAEASMSNQELLLTQNDSLKLTSAATKQAKITSAVKTFDSNIKSGNLSAYFYVINPTKVTIVNDPVYHSRRKVVYMKVNSADNAGLTKNPRAQLESPKQYIAGQNIWIGLSVYFPHSFYTNWLVFSEVYGEPYSAASPFKLMIDGNRISAIAHNGKSERKFWSEPLKVGRWYDFVYRELLGTTGSVQLYVRKQGEESFKLVLSNTTLPTITAANGGGPNYSKVANYWDRDNTWTDATKKTKVKSIAMYIANHKVGKTFAEVVPAYIK